MDVDKELMEEYVVEAKEHLDSIEEDFLEIERQKENIDEDLINKVFRAIHTIKGSAGFFGLISISNLSHVMETLLSQVRAGEKIPTSEMIDNLLDGVDLLNVMLDDIENSNDVDIKDVHDEIEAYINGDVEVSDSTAENEEKEEMLDLTESEVSQIPEGHHFIYELKYDALFFNSQKDVTPQDVKDNLLSTGAVIRENPEINSMTDTETGCSFIYSTVLDPDFVGVAVEIDDEYVKSYKLGDINIVSSLGAEDVPEGVVFDKQNQSSEIVFLDPDFKLVPEEHHFVYLLKYDLEKVKAERKLSPLELKKDLEGAGHIIKENMNINLDTDIKKTYYLIYSTVLDPKFVGEAAQLEDDNITHIEYKEQVKKQVAKEINKKDSKKASTSTSSSSDSIRIKLDVLDKLMSLAGELVLVRNQLLISANKTDSKSRNISQRLDFVTTEMQETIMLTRMQPVGNILNKFNRIVRDLGKKLGKKIELNIRGNDVEIDKTILEGLADPLTHIVRNSCDHGIESPEDRINAGKSEVGHVFINVYHEGGRINIEIQDDGRGLNTEKIKEKVLEKKLMTAVELETLSKNKLVELVFLPGFSTVDVISDVSGRGVGMDVVKSSIEKLGGVVEIETDLGFGTVIKIRLPLTLAIIPSLIVIVSGRRYAIPQVNLEELVTLYDEDVSGKIEIAGNKELYRLRDTLLPMVRLSEVFDRTEPFDEFVKADITDYYKNKSLLELEEYNKDIAKGKETEISLSFAVLKVGSMKYGLIIDEVIGTEEIVVKPMHKAVQDLNIYSGATVLGDGEVALILDILGISNHAGVSSATASEEELAESISVNDSGTDLLLFKNNEHEVFGLELDKIKRIEKIKIDDIEDVGGREFITIEGKSTLIVKFENYMSVDSTELREEMFLILPQGTDHVFGILVSELIDIGLYEYELDEDSYKSEGVLGTAIIDSKMTLLVDVDSMVPIINPSWA